MAGNDKSSPRFFFSSRRRHTRLVSDWSSDVCSSDLQGLVARISARLTLEPSRVSHRMAAVRSEERRVGKESRFSSIGEHEKTNQPDRTGVTERIARETPTAVYHGGRKARTRTNDIGL